MTYITAGLGAIMVGGHDVRSATCKREQVIVTALIVWFGFIGAWLLVAGPLFQGSLELRDQEIDRESIEAATAGITPGPRPSNWWWLIPPLMMAKLRHRSDDFQRKAIAALPADQIALLIGVRSMIYGWFIVSFGAAFIAIKETWELAEHYEWPLWVFLGMVVLPGMFAVLNALFANARRGEHDGASATRA